MVALSVFFLCAQAAQPLSETDETLFRYAEQLMAEGDYYRAIGEFKRLHFLSPQSPYSDSAAYSVGRCYLLAGRNQEAEVALSSYLETSPSSRLQPAARLGLGLARLRMREYEKARAAWRSLAAVTGVSSPSPASLATVASYLHELDFARARRSAAELGVGPEVLPLLAGKPARRSVAVALGMSALVPGSGQAYSGRLVDGLVSLLLNGLAGYGLHAGVAGHNTPAAVLSGTLLFALYTGNIYGAALAAKKYNDRAEAEYRAKLEAYLPTP